MSTSQTKIESDVLDLAGEALEAFCQDIAGMFGVEMESKEKELRTETADGLKKQFTDPSVIFSVQAEGALDGTFHIIFDRPGFFTLSGVTIMQPEKTIQDNSKNGSHKEAEELKDPMGEVGNLLVGSWDKLFREELEGHGHLLQSKTFLGDPWKKPKRSIGLNADEEFTFVPYEITIKPYPTFNCGVIFSKAIFAAEEKAEPESKPEEADSTKEKSSEAVVTEEQAETTEGEAVTEDNKAQPEEKAETAEQTESESKADDASVTEAAVEPVETVENEEKPVSKTIQKMTESLAELPGEYALQFLSLKAEDVMQKEVIWGSEDDSVEQLFKKMQQADNGYIMIGADGVLAGIVSKSDLNGAISPYLRPIFAKWRRPLDDATFQIKVKWIMSKVAHTVKPETLLVDIMGTMCRLGVRCLPVVDRQGSLLGQVTTFDIFKSLLKDRSFGQENSTAGQIAQEPPLI